MQRHIATTYLVVSLQMVWDHMFVLWHRRFGIYHHLFTFSYSSSPNVDETLLFVAFLALLRANLLLLIFHCLISNPCLSPCFSSDQIGSLGQKFREIFITFLFLWLHISSSNPLQLTCLTHEVLNQQAGEITRSRTSGPSWLLMLIIIKEEEKRRRRRRWRRRRKNLAKTQEL